MGKPVIAAIWMNVGLTVAFLACGEPKAAIAPGVWLVGWVVVGLFQKAQER
jgi:hypothetical protein